MISSSTKRKPLILYFWWLHAYPGNNWSKEERWLRMMVYAVGTLVVLIIYIPLYYAMSLKINEHWAAAISGYVGWVVGIPLARWLCGLFWPERVRKAEKNAAKRYGCPLAE